ncbi:NfeD family protein [Thalassolituus sp. LLYu03]|uniref:NfeD family protein n=1 Tax=Thalassolituus sp. LLYu03 TaxID=3421656 RepID=UPI003D2BF3E4
MEFLLQNLPQSLMVAGILALIIEVAVLGFATFILLFFGAALLLTGLAMAVGLLPESGSVAFASSAVLTAVLALLLWKPLKKMQDNVEPQQTRGDFATDRFVLEQDVDQRGLSVRRYSGIDWKLKSEQPLTAGTEVEVVKVEVGVQWVKAVG